MSYIRINIHEYVSLDLDEVFEEIEDDALLEECEDRGLVSNGRTSVSRRVPPRTTKEELLEKFDLPSLTSNEDLISHIEKLL